MMKRFTAAVLTAIMLFLLIVPAGTVFAAEEKTTARAVYIVFDNSGSMYGKGNMAWSQATYATEVFAAMLNFENGDTMKVYPMHPVSTSGSKGESKETSVMLSKKKDIEKIHNMYTEAPGDTPYSQVNKASADLKKALDDGAADEGWLIVLTDGDFDNSVPSGGVAVDLTKKAQLASDMYVQFLAVGSGVTNVPAGDASVGFYSQKATSSAEVTAELAEICNRIFRRNSIDNYHSGETLSFDIPMKKIIVFAQGENVSVESMRSSEDIDVKKQDSYAVSYSTSGGSGLTSYVTEAPVADTSLKGAVVTFANDESLAEGDYTLDVSDADQISVYYEPDVEFGVILYDGETPVDAKDTLEARTYTAKMGFINRLSGEFVESSSLLGNASYRLKAGEQEYQLTSADGAPVLQDITPSGTGKFTLDAGVTYLAGYNDSVSLTYNVNDIKISIDSPEGVKLKTLEDKKNGVLITVTKGETPLSEEQWNSGTVTVTSEADMEWLVEKGKEVSTYIAYPQYVEDDMFKTDTGAVDLTAQYSAVIDGKEQISTKTGELQVEDDKTIIDIIKRYWPQLLALLLLLILILGYIPPFKKRLPKRNKKRPVINCVAERPGLKDVKAHGVYKRDLLSALIPYMAQTGSLTFSPSPVRKTAKLKAAGGGGMYVTNVKAFAGKSNITFNGMSVEAGRTKKLRIPASSAITVRTDDYIYTCHTR